LIAKLLNAFGVPSGCRFNSIWGEWLWINYVVSLINEKFLQFV